MPESDETRQLQAIEACEGYYLHGKTQKEIASKLGVSTATVSRLLRYARQHGFVRVAIHPPRNVELARRVQELFSGSTVREVIVVSNGRKAVGQAAARFLEEHGFAECSVLIDGGYTVFEFVESLAMTTLANLTIIPAANDPPSYDVSAFELMTRLAARIDGAECLKLPYASSSFLEPYFRKAHDAAKQTDFAFIGAGPWSRGFTALEFIKHLGEDPNKLELQSLDISAVSAYHAVDAAGRHVPLPILESLRTALQFDDYQQLAKSETCKLCLLAAGAQKAEAIQAVVAAGMCNVCILDEDLATRLCADLPVGAPTRRRFDH